MAPIEFWPYGWTWIISKSVPFYIFEWVEAEVKRPLLDLEFYAFVLAAKYEFISEHFPYDTNFY